VVAGVLESLRAFFLLPPYMRSAAIVTTEKLPQPWSAQKIAGTKV
jgi:hypothetical protein